MLNNQRTLQNSNITYIPCLESPTTPIKEIFWALTNNACAVISELYPASFFPKMHRLVAQRSPVQFQLIDTNGLYPLSEAKRFFTTAASFRRHLQKTITPFLTDFPNHNPVDSLVNCYRPSETDFSRLMLDYFNEDISQVDLCSLPINHNIKPVIDRMGGHSEASKHLHHFLQSELERYDADRNSVENDPSSRLSPYFTLDTFHPMRSLNRYGKSTTGTQHKRHRK